MEISIRVGGEAGQGLQTIGASLSRIFARTGLHVFSHQDYMSRVRGGHNFYQIRVSTGEVFCSRRGVDLLVALDLETIEHHQGDLRPGAVVLYDGDSLGRRFEGSGFLDVPMSVLAGRQGGPAIAANSVAIGAVLGMLNLGLAACENVLQETFGKKGEETIRSNREAVRAGHRYAQDHCRVCDFGLTPPHAAPRRMLFNGSEAVGFGALVSGCRFYAAYPMTPSTGIMNYLSARASRFGLVVEQAEDEIAAINMALGASFAGVRAMTGSSGGGFALMVEGLSLAAMTETPIVVAEVQRPGPATGLPTRTEQGDLEFVLHGGHGEFPRVVFAPGHPAEAITLTNRAFDLAERFQVPAFVISDQYLADSEWTPESPDRSRIRYEDYRIREASGEASGYRRHVLTADGVSPLAVPGLSERLVVTDSDEHDEDGHLIEDAETRRQMVEKRIGKKLSRLRAEMEPPEILGDGDAPVIVAGWGSTFGVIREAVEVLRAEGRRITQFHFSQLWPFPAPDRFDVGEGLRAAERTICVENNATGQFERLVRAETGYRFTASVRKYDGRPFLLEELVEALRERLETV